MRLLITRGINCYRGDRVQMAPVKIRLTTTTDAASDDQAVSLTAFLFQC